MQKEIEKIFFVSEIIASENVAINCICQEGNTDYWMSIC